jgi:invasion protein IalB
MMKLRQGRLELKRGDAAGAGPWLFVVIAMTLCALTFGVTSRAPAQPAEMSSGAVQPEYFLDGEIQPRGERKPREIIFSPWQKLCFTTSDTAKTLCRTTTSGRWDSGQTVVRIDLIERDGALRVQAFLPTGVYLQAGVSISIDDGPAIQIPYTWCFTNGCVAAAAVSSDLIEKLESGQNLTMKAVDSNAMTVSTSISLAQLSAVRRGAATRLFDRSLQAK